jgi:hypothetical protein
MSNAAHLMASAQLLLSLVAREISIITIAPVAIAWRRLTPARGCPLEERGDRAPSTNRRNSRDQLPHGTRAQIEMYHLLAHMNTDAQRKIPSFCQNNAATFLRG